MQGVHKQRYQAGEAMAVEKSTHFGSRSPHVRDEIFLRFAPEAGKFSQTDIFPSQEFIVNRT